MKKKLLLSILALGLFLNTFCQSTIELSFTAVDNADFEQLDSIMVMNKTQGGDTVLYYPDTNLVLDYQVGISEINTGYGRFQVFQNYPNPVKDKTIISFYIPEKDNVSLFVTDILGRVLINTEHDLDNGYHLCQLTLGKGSLFILTVQWRESSSSIKILQPKPFSNNTWAIEYMGGEDTSPEFMAKKVIQSFLFNLGDELLYIGYIDTLQSGILDTPQNSMTCAFQFATNIPCPGTPSVEYGGQIYNTIQILSQCWLKENLNIGTMIHGDTNMTNNDILEKYCYENEPDSCSKYGGLYQWNEMMQYTTQQGTQGICPSGWHLPTDEELKVLEGVVDSLFGVGSPEWDIGMESRGYDANINLKAISGWDNNGNGTNLFGFLALPGGYRYPNGTFGHAGISNYLWSATVHSTYNAWYRALRYDKTKVGRYNTNKRSGFSVRCLRN